MSSATRSRAARAIYRGMRAQGTPRRDAGLIAVRSSFGAHPRMWYWVDDCGRPRWTRRRHLTQEPMTDRAALREERK